MCLPNRVTTVFHQFLERTLLFSLTDSDPGLEGPLPRVHESSEGVPRNVLLSLDGPSLSVHPFPCPRDFWVSMEPPYFRFEPFQLRSHEIPVPSLRRQLRPSESRRPPRKCV